jgi:mRNA interferase YafQ
MASRKLVLSSSFERSYRKFTKHDPEIKAAIQSALSAMEQDVFSSRLKTHKLSGNLYGLFACSCGYDCRIIFSVEKRKNEEVIILIDIGTHDEAY